MEEESGIVVDLVARLVARGEHERAELMARVSRKVQAGEDPARDEQGGIDWRGFVIRFAQQYPLSTAFAPISAGIYLYLLYQLFFGG